jgi:uncharacterized protein
MTAQVFFSQDPSLAATIFDAAGFSAIITAGEPVALKIHFGEPGNTAYLKPARVQPIFDRIGTLGGKPFYTDCNTLYRGRRHLTKDHLDVAREHGYQNVIIPEEDDQAPVTVNLKHFKQVFLGGTAVRSQTIIALTHFKGHEVTGFGGTLKNLGMGFGSRKGKLKCHQDCKNCPEAKACQKNKTLEACWFGSPALVQEKIVEYAYGAVKGKRCGYLSFLTDVSPACDCYPHNDPPVTPDLGVLASNDPVALDQASIDLVNRSAGRDIFRELYPAADWTVQLKYAEAIGLGSRKYELVIK